MTGFLPLSLPPPLVGLSSASSLLSPPRSPNSPFKSRAREVALFLELVLLLLLGSTCRHHHGVFVPRIPRATLATLWARGPAKKHSRITRMRTRSNCEFTTLCANYCGSIDRIVTIGIDRKFIPGFPMGGMPLPGGSLIGMPLIFFVSASRAATQRKWSAVLSNSGPLCSRCNPSSFFLA